MLHNINQAKGAGLKLFTQVVELQLLVSIYFIF